MFISTNERMFRIYHLRFQVCSQECGISKLCSTPHSTSTTWPQSIIRFITSIGSTPNQRERERERERQTDRQTDRQRVHPHIYTDLDRSSQFLIAPRCMKGPSWEDQEAQARQDLLPRSWADQISVFLFKKRRRSTFSDRKDARLFPAIMPAAEYALSDLVEVAGTARYFLANLAKCGKLVSFVFHHCSGSVVVSQGVPLR